MRVCKGMYGYDVHRTVVPYTIVHRTRVHRQRKKVERKVDYRGVRGVSVEISLKIIGITSDFSQNLKWQIRYNLVPIPR